MSSLFPARFASLFSPSLFFATVSLPLCLPVVIGCAPAPDGSLTEAAGSPAVELQQQAHKTVAIDPRRSLAVTEQVILERFSFQRVMDHLVARSGVDGLTALELYQQWWDTQNRGPSLGLGAHCDDQRDADQSPTLNGYPYDCRSEGVQAFEDPFADPQADAAYLPVGLFNRFDLAPADGSHCGEHRVVFARRQGTTSDNHRNLIILEAVMPNPHPAQGLKGCQKVARFWAQLSEEDDAHRRADALEGFYFQGIANLPPVLDVDHLGAGPEGRGQIRTNQFIAVPERIWTLREFKLSRGCNAVRCPGLLAVPVTVKGNPFGPLFYTGAVTHPRSDAFRAHFRSQLAALAAPTLDAIDMKVPDEFNSPQSHSSGSRQNRYVGQFTDGDGAFGYELDQALSALGSTLSATEVVTRAQALSCAGCHRLNDRLPLGGGLVWPASLGFVHVSEQLPEPSVDGPRYRISDALTDAFLPRRQQVLQDYLQDKPLHVRHPGDPIGGRRVH